MTHLLAGTGIFVAILVYALNRYSMGKFQYAFFSKPTLYISLAASALLLGGIACIPVNIHAISVRLTASVLLAMATASIIVWLVYINCMATSIWFGLAGSIVQIPLLMAISIIAVPVLLVGAAIWIFGGAGRAQAPQPKSYYQQQMDWHYNRMNPNGFHKKWY